MAGPKMVCTTNNVDYITIRKAMCSGARTVEEITKATGICNECEGCKTMVEPIRTSVCGCKQVSLQAVVDAVQNGADTVDKVGEQTGAGTACGRCKALIENIIALGR